MGFAGALVAFNGRAVTEDVSTLFGLISRMRIGVRFAVAMSLLFTVGVRELKIPRTPDRRITPLFGSGKIGRWPAHALVIVAHIPVPLRILRRLSAGHSPRTTRAAIINAHYSRMSGIYAAWRAKDARPPRGPPGPSGGCAAFTIVAPCRLRAASRRPWSVEATDACFIVRDASGQARACVYCEDATLHG
jgi:hypothetical protein